MCIRDRCYIVVVNVLLHRGEQFPAHGQRAPVVKYQIHGQVVLHDVLRDGIHRNAESLDVYKRQTVKDSRSETTTRSARYPGATAPRCLNPKYCAGTSVAISIQSHIFYHSCQKET